MFLNWWDVSCGQCTKKAGLKNKGKMRTKLSVGFICLGSFLPSAPRFLKSWLWLGPSTSVHTVSTLSCITAFFSLVFLIVHASTDLLTTSSVCPPVEPAQRRRNLRLPCLHSAIEGSNFLEILSLTMNPLWQQQTFHVTIHFIQESLQSPSFL